MRVNIGQIAGTVERLLPWDLELQIGERVYPTVRPTLGLVADLERTNGRVSGGLDAVLRIFAGDDKPDLLPCTGNEVAAIVAAYLVHFEVSLKGNSPALVAEARRALAAGATTTAAGPTSGASS